MNLASIFRLSFLLFVFSVSFIPIHAADFTLACNPTELTDAILTANTNAQADTLNLASGCIYTLGSTLHIQADGGNSLTINGNGAMLDGNNAIRVMEIHPSAHVVLNNLTIARGNLSNSEGGSGIYNQGTLTVNNTSFTLNTAGYGAAIENLSILTANHSTFTLNNAPTGGAVLNHTMFTVNNSIFSMNSSNNGGAILNYNTLTLNNTTFSGNNSISGGGIYNQGTLSINHSIFSGNISNVGGGIYNGGPALINNSTFSGNSGTGGGLFTFMPLTLNNSIIANSVTSDCYSPGGDAPIFYYSLIEDGSCGATAGSNGNLNGDPYFNSNLTLSSISPAINAGNNALIPAGIISDLAGNPRIQQGTVDMGAYESIFSSGGGAITVNPSSGLTTSESGTTATFTVVIEGGLPTADVTVALTSSNLNEGAVSPASLTFTPANWNIPQSVTVTGVDDALIDGDQTYQIMFAVASADATYNGFTLAPVTLINTDDDTVPQITDITVAPSSVLVSEGSSAEYVITLGSVPSGAVSLAIQFDPAQVTVNGATTSPFVLDVSAGGAFYVTITGAQNLAENTSRQTLISHSISASSASEYPLDMSITNVTVFLQDFPPPPPTPLCEDHNFSESGVVRSSTSDALGYAINCRILYQNGAPTTWLGNNLYHLGSIGIEGLEALGIQQAIDIFSPSGMTYFEGGAVFCVKGSGSLIWLAASQMPRHPEIIGSYTVPEFQGFTCATLFEPGTLVIVSQTPN